ncbi:MAG: hypothetical protein V4511_03035 [Bacteroidota bacterium]
MSDELLKELIETFNKNNGQIVKALVDIKHLLSSNQSDYCETEEALRIIGLNNYRYLAQLHKKNMLPRYPRGDGFKYKKADCYKVAAALDNQQIVLEPLSKGK